MDRRRASPSPITPVKHRERPRVRLAPPCVRIRPMREQEFGDALAGLCCVRRWQAVVAETQERLPALEPAFFSDGCRLCIENSMHLVHITGDDGRMDVALHHVGIASEQARRILPSLRRVDIAGWFPLPRARLTP